MILSLYAVSSPYPQNRLALPRRYSTVVRGDTQYFSSYSLLQPQNQLKNEHEPVSKPGWKQTFQSMIESGLMALEYICWKLSAQNQVRKQMPTIKRLYQEIRDVNPASVEYIQHIIKLNQSFAQEKPMLLNLESGRIQQIVRHPAPTIFIFSHHQPQFDSVGLALVQTFLYQNYWNTGQANTCPRPKILANQMTLWAMPSLLAKLFQKVGLEGVNARVIPTRRQALENRKTLQPIIQAVSNQQVHLFMFPSGRRFLWRHRPAEEQFQLGICKLADMIAKRSERVRIVPVGFAYPKKSNSSGLFASVWMGEPIWLNYRAGQAGEVGQFEVSKANLGKKNQSSWSPLFARTGVFTLPQARFDRLSTLGGVLHENLRVCDRQAQLALDAHRSFR